jgi:hypothetical protein
LALTSMCTFVVLRKGLPIMRGVSHISTTKSIGTKMFHIFTEIFSVIPAG